MLKFQNVLHYMEMSSNYFYFFFSKLSNFLFCPTEPVLCPYLSKHYLPTNWHLVAKPSNGIYHIIAYINTIKKVSSMFLFCSDWVASATLNCYHAYRAIWRGHRYHWYPWRSHWCVLQNEGDSTQKPKAD